MKKNILLLLIAVFLMLGIVGAVWSISTLLHKNSSLVQNTAENYQKFTASELSDICATPEGYTDAEWKEHMSHHPDRYKECLSASSSQSIYNNIDSVTLKTMLDNKNFFLVDVHIPEQEHIPNTDALIPYNQLASNVALLPKDKNTPIVVYCRSGNMSATASAELLKMGYKNIYNLTGGLKAWKSDGYSVVNSSLL